MKCHAHNSSEAVGVCAHCGRALCRECVTSPAPVPLACSPACAEQTARLATAIQLLVERSAQNARASAAYCYLSAVLSGGAAVAAWFWLPSPFLMTFAGGGALALAAAGFWHGRVARGNFSAKVGRRAPGPVAWK
jgi:hypothetical protein